MEEDNEEISMEVKKSIAGISKAASSSKHRAQKYKKDWEKLLDLKNWLQPDPKNQFRAKCRLCNGSSFTAELTVIKNHQNTKKHKLFEERYKQGKPHSVENFFKNSEPAQTSSDVSSAEIKLEIIMYDNFTRNTIILSFRSHNFDLEGWQR